MMCDSSPRMSELRAAFLNPGNEYSPIPFWFWNDTLTEEEILRQIRDFHSHGVDGFVIHPRKGLPAGIPYLSDGYMRFVRTAVEEACRLDMRVILYDEAMYPSGSAHGMVAKENPQWASRALIMETAQADVPEDEALIAVCAATVAEKTIRDVEVLQPSGGLYRRPGDHRVLLCFRQCFSGGTIRGVHEGEDDGEPFAPPSSDLLNPDAVRAFIRLTHERYYEALGEYFGSTIIAMFTDEPDIVGRNARPGCIAWTTGFLDSFGDPRDLPALFADMGEETDAIRLRYRRAISQRMGEAYYGQLAAWCAAHGIALTGHPAKGWEIGLLRHFQIPGQDVVWRHVSPGKGIDGTESVLAKCASDAARHDGRRRNANECFGCCGPDGLQWAFSVDDMKWYMDYLFVRGTNLLIPHAFFYSLRDDRKNERPPDVGPHNLWWPMYQEIAMYIRRMSWLMTDSVNQARVAVLCEADCLPWKNCRALYENQIEFNYLELDRLKECVLRDGLLHIGQQRYAHILIGQADIERLPRDAVITPPAPNLRISHIVKQGLDFYLLVNEGESLISGKLSVLAKGRAQWWDAWNGSASDAPVDREGCYRLNLPRRESRILCVDPHFPPADLADHAPRFHAGSHAPVVAEWKLTRMDTGETIKVTTNPQGCLPGWENVWRDYSGWVTYETNLFLPHDALLSLGCVHSLVFVCRDGQLMDKKYWAPYAFKLSAGENRLSIHVCNTLANRLEHAAWPSGILGPIEILSN